ncbi:alpha/beta hydrolase [Roseiarcaceae bacterium H3SJ34-1]|uniref:alpha/beta hydrolase n=1 Tax=Terripilifer ovatus TaxID=3032367 RepID=UPI003AB94C0E|nr:alpha/beta hydrolase [Roseiarcaceae bacterium H3SJ34-1]
MRWVRGLLYVVIAAYLGASGFLYVRQRDILYRPNVTAAAVPLATLPGVTAKQIKTADGETLAAWFVPPRNNKPILLYLHGNGGNLANRTRRFALMTAQGAGLLAIDWRGYGGSTGSPSEDGLMRDAEAAYRSALETVRTPRRIVIVGESLGSGPAVMLAAYLDCAGLILDSAYSSILDVASEQYWMFPVRLLLADQYRSDLRIAEIRAPLLAMHGDQDRIVPIKFGERLFALAPQPKEFIRVPGRDHLVLALDDVWPRVLAWIDRLPSP